MKSIRKELLTIISVTLIGLLIILGTANMDFLNEIKDDVVDRTNKELLLKYDEKIKAIVSSNMRVLDYYNEQYEQGNLTLKEAKSKAKELLRESRYGKDDVGYFWIDNKEYVNVLLPPALDAEGGSRKDLKDENDTYIVQELVDGAIKNGSTYLDYYFPKPGEDEASLKRGYTEYFEPWGWVIGTGNYVEDIEKVVGEVNKDLESQINEVLLTFLVIMVISFIVVLVLLYIYSDRLSKAIKYLSCRIEEMSNYDLSSVPTDRENKLSKKKNELGIIARAVKEMRSNLKDLINEINSDAMDVSSSSEELTATSEQVSIASDEVAETTQEIANGATDQAEETTQGAKGVNELGEIINSEIELVEMLNKSAKRVDSLKEEGFVVLKDLEEKTVQNNESAKEVQDIIIKTNANADKIEKASDKIMDIAEQTNLLALNASIEAARAGEAGKGFAVVADEIRKLAEETNTFASSISDTINKLNEMTEKGVTTMKKSSKITEEQIDSLEKTNSKFNGISDSIEDVDKIVKELNEATEDMTNKKGQIIDVMENLSAISEENAAGTQEVSASVEEQTVSMAQVSEASEELAELAQEMQESISKFKL